MTTSWSRKSSMYFSRALIASLPKEVALGFGHQPVGLVDEQHPAERLLADLLDALRGL